MKVAILLNSALAEPSIPVITEKHEIVGIGIGSIGNDGAGRFTHHFEGYGFPVEVFEKESHEETMSHWLRLSNADVVLVYTFNFKISKSCLNIPKYGFFNFHPGELPQERGNPLFWILRNRQDKCTLTVHKMSESIDCGPIYAKDSFPMGEGLTFGAALEGLAERSAEITSRLLDDLTNTKGSLSLEPQDESAARFFPKPTTSDIQIDWHRQTADQIQALVRACNPFCEGAIANIDNREVRILEAKRIEHNRLCLSISAGGLATTDANELSILCAENTVLKIEVLCDSGGCYSGKEWLLRRLHSKSQSDIE